jgi:hypothetical protein
MNNVRPVSGTTRKGPALELPGGAACEIRYTLLSKRCHGGKQGPGAPFESLGHARLPPPSRHGAAAACCTIARSVSWVSCKIKNPGTPCESV